MEQDLIKTLLQKAASPDCSVNIRKAVYEELSKHMNEHPYVNSVCKEVYFQTAKNKPEKLLNLFPLFASVSGDKRPGNTMFADIDWSLID